MEFCSTFNFPFLLSMEIEFWDGCMQLFTASRGNGAFLNGNPIKGVLSVLYLLIVCY